MIWQSFGGLNPKTFRYSAPDTMALCTEYEMEPEGTTVPYPPLFDSVRRNHGFKDLRGDAGAAENIPEAAMSEALRRLLVKLAQLNHRILSLGCDLGEHEEANESPSRRRVAGGYVQIAAADYEKASPESYRSFAIDVERVVKKLSNDDHWKIQFVLKGVAFEFEGSPKTICPSLWIWFFASAGDKDRAVHSRERLIASLTSAVSRGGVLAKLATSS